MKLTEIMGGSTKCKVCGVRCGYGQGAKSARMFRVVFRDSRVNEDDSVRGHYTFNLCGTHLIKLKELIGAEILLKTITDNR